MSDVEFNEGESMSFQTNEEPGKIISLVLSMRLAEDVQQANKVLLIISVIAISLTAFVVLSFGNSAQEEIDDPYVVGGPAILE